MGVVYKALYPQLGRVVALKVILDRAPAGPDQLARFHREAKAVARLQHPNIVQIYDIGEHEGQPYIALEYVGGGSLAEKLRTQPPTPRAAAELVAKLARAVHHAHEHGVLHRDLKPSNILLTPEGQPKIADFGLAKLQEAPNVDLNATASGVIIGTPRYMAPEQAAGKVKELGPGVDIYCVGAILYELLTGQPPFRGASVFEVVAQLVADQVVPPHTLNPAVGRDLSAICLKCLEKEPQQRYSSAQGLAEDLENWLAGRPITALRATSISRLLRWFRRSLAVVFPSPKRA
jgi:serine/threonine protein kinase